MKKLIPLLLLAGCSMSNDEVIRESMKCEAAGMEAQPMMYLWNGRIAEVQCWPKKEAKSDGRI